MINAAFSPEMLQWYDFTQNPEEGRFVVHYETKKEQKQMIWNINGDLKPAHDTGKAWIDPAAMQVARFERNLLNIGRMSVWKITIEQSPFTIGEGQFWLPKSFSYRDHRARSSRHRDLPRRIHQLQKVHDGNPDSRGTLSVSSGDVDRIPLAPFKGKHKPELNSVNVTGTLTARRL
jgi:hypothetical protein